MPRQVWDQRREEVLFKVRGRRSCSDARNAIMMQTRWRGISHPWQRTSRIGARPSFQSLPLWAGWNTVVRSDNLPRAVPVHPDIGEAVAVFVGFALGGTLFVIRTSDNCGLAMHSNF